MTEGIPIVHRTMEALATHWTEFIETKLIVRRLSAELRKTRVQVKTLQAENEKLRHIKIEDVLEHLRSES